MVFGLIMTVLSIYVANFSLVMGLYNKGRHAKTGVMVFFIAFGFAFALFFDDQRIP